MCKYASITDAGVSRRSAQRMGRGSKAKFSVSTGETWRFANLFLSAPSPPNSLPLPASVLIVLTTAGVES